MKLLDALTRPIDDFDEVAERHDTPDGPYFFQDNGAKVLAVAHLDDVMWSTPVKRSHKVYCPQLDDRLGVFCILGLLPQLGINVDVLLTDGEEMGRSTGYYFDPPKEYNWFVEFDRAGSDVVMYQYETRKKKNLLKQYGFKTAFGAFSDISSMDHLGVWAFNVGIGYYAQHTQNCWANLQVTKSQVLKFAKFWEDHKDTPYAHNFTQPKRKKKSKWANRSNYYDGQYWDSLASGYGAYSSMYEADEADDFDDWARQREEDAAWEDYEPQASDYTDDEMQDLIHAYGKHHIEDVAVNFGYTNIRDFIEAGGEEYL
jgi:hypothetical protein